MQVSVQELQAHLSQYISQAQAGQSIDITSQRKIVARIIGIAASPAPHGLAGLLANGAATWAAGKPVGATLKLHPTGTPVSRMVLEDRG